MTELSEAAASLRERILGDADHTRAGIVANLVLDQTLDAFNHANTSIATSFLARALVLRGLLHVAGLWLNDVTTVPTPECFAAMRSIADDPPPGFEGMCWNEETGDVG